MYVVSQYRNIDLGSPPHCQRVPLGISRLAIALTHYHSPHDFVVEDRMCHELNTSPYPHTSPYVIPGTYRVPRALYQFVPCPAHTLSLVPSRPDSSCGPVRSGLSTRHRTRVSVPRVATCVLIRSSLRHINGTRHPIGLPRPDW